MNLDNRLLAKSWKEDTDPPLSVFLQGHLPDVLTAANHVLDCTGDDQLAALGLTPEPWRDRFRRMVLLGAALHDIGKANEHFAQMVRGKRKLQGLRHEWVTWMILQSEGWREWLAPALATPDDWDFLLWTVSSHHPAYDRPSPPSSGVEGAGSEMKVLLGHPDMKAILGWLQTTFALTDSPACSDVTLRLTGSDSAFVRLVQSHQQAMQRWERCTRDERNLVAAAKNCLIAADIAGSALPKTGTGADDFGRVIRTAFARVPTPEEVRQLIKDRLGSKKLRRFQELGAESPTRVTLAQAGCGSGKTLMAYHWAAEKCPGKRCYICYPTTGTATEGFREYLFDPAASAGKAGANLFHGRAEVDVKIILEVDSDADGEADTLARFDALEAWSTPVVSCTVDTVLGLMQNNRRGLYCWPALAGAAFVFDEIHAYDDRLFGALLRFLQTLRGVPVLLMTASLPTARRKALEQCLSRQGETLNAIPGPVDLETLPRYRRGAAATPDDPLPEVKAELERTDRPGKVLWVCNTVDRVIAAAERAKALEPLIYHSRFRYEDRVKRHAGVIDCFKKDGPALAICSQVAEMSLDLSATLLASDLAPVPFLIQRLGRLNRRATPPAPGEDPPPAMPFLIIEPKRPDGSPQVLPYIEPELASARDWLTSLGTNPLSQADLAQKWECRDSDRRPGYVPSAWLDGGPSTQVLELRESSPGITVVLERDLAALKSGTKRVVEVALPMPPPPRGMTWRTWTKFKGVPVAPHDTISYDPERGAQWRR